MLLAFTWAPNVVVASVILVLNYSLYLQKIAEDVPLKPCCPIHPKRGPPRLESVKEGSDALSTKLPGSPAEMLS